MNHHSNNVDICPLCEDKLIQAHFILQHAFRKIKEKFKDCHISWTYRGKLDQEKFFKQGLTKRNWPKSEHNKFPSRAIDLFQLSPDNKAIYKNAYFKEIAQFLVRELIPVVWSGDWTSFREYDHFEVNEKGEK